MTGIWEHERNVENTSRRRVFLIYLYKNQPLGPALRGGFFRLTFLIALCEERKLFSRFCTAVASNRRTEALASVISFTFVVYSHYKQPLPVNIENPPTVRIRIFFYCVKKTLFGELFSEIYFQSSSEFTFLWNLGKFKIQLNQPRWPMEFIQNSTFSTRQYRKKGTCLGFIFTKFVIYSLVILLS